MVGLMTKRLKRAAVLYALGGVLSAYLAGGMFFSESMHRWASADPEYGQKWARSHRREVLGWSILVGSMYGLAWPMALPAAWLMTGFAEHGLWNDHIDRRG
jgi:hypothetical protein